MSNTRVKLEVIRAIHATGNGGTFKQLWTVRRSFMSMVDWTFEVRLLEDEGLAEVSWKSPARHTMISLHLLPAAIELLAQETGHNCVTQGCVPVTDTATAA